MSEKRPPPDPVDAEFELLEDAADRVQFEQSADMTEAELRAELDAMRAEEAVARMSAAAPPATAPPPAEKKPAEVVSLAKAREKRRVPMWLLVAAVAVGIGLLGGGGVLVADYFGPTPPPSSPNPVPSGPPQPSPQMLAAEKLRSAAENDCARHQWGACLDELDQAAKLDPTSDSRAEVQAMRNAASSGLYPDAGADARAYVKPPVGPGEVPAPRPTR